MNWKTWQDLGSGRTENIETEMSLLIHKEQEDVLHHSMTGT